MQHQVSREELETPQVQVALKFGTALLNSQFDKAYSFLGLKIHSEWSPSLLRDTYEEMVDYFETPPSEVFVGAVYTEVQEMDSNSAWIYISIIGDCDLEAVTVVVSYEDKKYLIQELTWGRP